MVLSGRSQNTATPAERGEDYRPDPVDASGTPPKDVRHDLETLTDHDGPPVERCRHCQRAASLGTIDPFAPCPGQRDGDPESYVNVEAETIPTY
jgi:hypothetical protein